MIEAEMDELALLWREQEPAQEQALFQTLARRVGWRARLLRYADRGAAIIIATGVALLVLLEGGGAAAASGFLIVLAVGWSTWKRHALWDIELSLSAANSEAFLADAEQSIRARLKRTDFAIASLVPGFALGLLFGMRLRHPELDSAREMWAFVTGNLAMSATVAAILVLLMVHFAYSRKGLRRELAQVDRLAGEYRHEAESEAAAAEPSRP